MYEPVGYWEKLLNDRPGLAGVADPSQAEFALARSYRVVRRNAFRLLRDHGLRRLDGCHVLDVGSGSGYWLSTWHESGARSVTGIELTSVGSERLRRTHGYATVLQCDVGAETFDLAGKFDLISAMSVMLHIVDDAAFRRALGRLAEALAPQGTLLVADPVLTRRDTRLPPAPGDNSVARPLREWQEASSAVGLEIVAVRASTVLQGNPIDVRDARNLSRLNRLWWEFGRLQRRAPSPVAKGVVNLTALADQALTHVPAPAISSKLMLLRRIGTDV